VVEAAGAWRCRNGLCGRLVAAVIVVAGVAGVWKRDWNGRWWWLHILRSYIAAVVVAGVWKRCWDGR
jgi:hypothetical protein